MKISEQLREAHKFWTDHIDCGAPLLARAANDIESLEWQLGEANATLSKLTNSVCLLADMEQLRADLKACAEALQEARGFIRDEWGSNNWRVDQVEKPLSNPRVQALLNP